MSRPVVAVTMGDPCGIGPEVILKSLGRRPSRTHRIVVIGDLRVFEQTATRLRQRLPSWHVVSHRQSASLGSGPLILMDAGHREAFRPGRSGAAAGRASLDYLDLALELWREGGAQALVTVPVTKWAVGRLYPRFVGQTEYLAHGCRATSPVMMFVAERLRMVLLTRHLALRDVPSRVTPSLMRTTLQVTTKGLREYFGIRRPRLAICGLNPHAGEAGAFGDEERRVLAPVLRGLGSTRARVEGPFAADGFFVNPQGYDAVVCWYHDQGLIPFKMLARDQGCQLSLGLPFIRTSPDHGSALDIAGKGLAHPGSMRYALALAERLCLRRLH
ncbi:MAG TPA: 4-hydroxythreonine-4-phosphate dehydrogenase PdxA [Candidatus Omnitrophica bacterium]|nr:MAG: 4-hydroxythreonine-4-phosphate dehydrogenase PdxA [Omnitrophica WOR_2 bacterium RIFCSPHIGHO2_12_FULL_64_13]OGX36815.1 MAG: 4-hydroxythreonine-4-phosphate dehydrogenase PdxA [Omnitrophica WOR_2 bacterium RIFCSPHIGHO2_02_FULL_63_39]HBH96584.1 4-hydroxythreonine-4-phosphate dehydrogenase PdxA [Candidatus Omnitrophota bacterium]